MPAMTRVLRTSAGYAATWLLHNLARFLFWWFAVAVAFGGITGAATYALVREETNSCQIASAVIVALGTFLVATISGAAMTATKTLEKWIAATNLGPMVSQAIFAQVLGVSDKRPEGRTELAKSLQGAKVGDVRRRLKEAFSEAFASKSLDRWLPATGKWLASKIVNTAGAAAANLALDRIPGDPEEETPIDLRRVRDDLSAEIQQQASGFVTFRSRLLASSAFLIGVVVVPVLVLAVREGARVVGG